MWDTENGNYEGVEDDAVPIVWVLPEDIANLSDWTYEEAKEWLADKQNRDYLALEFVTGFYDEAIVQAIQYSKDIFKWKPAANGTFSQLRSQQR